jgi:hypothetical protein
VLWSGAAESRWASNSSGSIDRSDAIKSGMRSIFVAIIALLPASIALAQSGNPKADPPIPQGKLLPAKQPRAPPMAPIVQISGSVSVGVRGSVGAR